MAQSIRYKIIEYLKKNLTASALELSTVLGVTKPNIQYHLKKLLTENVIEVIDESAASAEQRERGRPEKFYRFSIIKTPDNFVYLSGLLLEIFLSSNSSINNIRSLANHFSLDVQEKSNLAEKFTQIVSALNQHQYFSHWEIHNNGPRIIFKNCPYARIVSEFPELCEMDRLILEKNSGCKTTQISNITHFDQNPNVCVFQLILNS